MKRRLWLLLPLFLLIAGFLNPVAPVHADEGPYELRTRTSKLFYLGDDWRGSHYVLSSSIGSIHYKDQWDNWQDIERGYYISDSGEFTAQFTRLPYVVRIGDDSFRRIYPDRHDLSYWIDIGKPFPNMGAPDKAGNVWTWDYPNAAMQVTVANTAVKLNFTLKNSNAPTSISFPYSTYGIERQGRTLLRDGQVIGILRKPYAIDSEGVYRDVSIDFSGGEITISLDTSGLTFPIEIDPTVDVDVAASGDDGYRYGASFNNALSTLKIGNDQIGATDYTADAFGCFLGITIAQSSTIDSANLSAYEYNSVGTILTNIYFEDANDPAAPTDSADYQGRTPTTAFVAVDGDPGANGYYTTSITAIIQELVDSYDYSNEAMQALWKDDGSDTGGDNYLQQFTYDQTPNGDYAMQLDIAYTAGGVSAPTVTSDNSSSVEETTALLAGNVTASSENVTERGFEWGTSTGSYTANTTESGSWGTGTFSLNATSLSPGTTYYWRAMAYNSGGWGYGSELYLTTKPQVPTGFTDSARTSSQITLTWTKGGGSENTTIRYRTDQAPTDYNDGTGAYNDTGTTANVTSLSAGQIYYFGAWAINTDNTTLYSDSSAQITAYTLPANPSSLSTSNATDESILLSWTLGTGGDKTHIRYKTGSYPSSVSDGSQAYFDTSDTHNVTGLTSGTQYFFTGWAYDSDSGYYSSGYTQATGNTTGTAPPVTPAAEEEAAATTLSGEVTLQSTRLLGLFLIYMAIVLAYSTKDFIFYMASGIITLIVSSQWVSDYPGLTVTFWALSTYLLIQSVLKMYESAGSSRGWSQFKGFYHRIRGQVNG